MDDGFVNALTRLIKALRMSLQKAWSDKTIPSETIETWQAKQTARTSLFALLSSADSRYADPKRLIRAYAQVYSQCCEDGFIAEIFARIKPKHKTFLEIGIEDGLQNTTRLLLEQGWQGIWIEGSSENASRAKVNFASYIESGHLKIIDSIVTAENVNSLLDAVEAPSEFDFMSVDIDQNTTHVWRALGRKSRAACIEYNASLPPSAPLEVPYDPDAMWDGTNWFGGSLKTLELIGRDKGLNLVGCDPIGVNAYFVRSDETADLFCAPFTAENHFELPKFTLLTHIGHPPSSIAKKWISTP